jgi:hypothetical protein
VVDAIPTCTASASTSAIQVGPGAGRIGGIGATAVGGSADHAQNSSVTSFIIASGSKLPTRISVAPFARRTCL